VVIGVIQGDTHDIGKNLVKIMLEASRFEVFDLGRDVPPARFVEKAKEVGADLIAVSTLMTTTMEDMGMVIKLLEEDGSRSRFRVMVGGGPISKRFADRIGADGYAVNAGARQVQLTKGAIRTGIDLLLKSAGLDASEVDTVLVAEAFGYHSRIESLVNIGLLPESFLGKIRLVGNTSKSGSVAFLLNKESRRAMRCVADGTEVVDLADCVGFDRAFTQSLAFHKGVSRPKGP
jgi:methylmalonyl-CoA mutase cobalamin-binding subunit